MWIWCWLSCWWWNYMLKMCIYVYFVFHSKLMKNDVIVDELLMNSWLVVVVAVMRCCCWWLKPWVIIIIELDVKLSCSWRFLWKIGQMVIFVEMMFWFKFYMDLSVFSCLETFRQVLGSNLGIGKSKLEFWGENWVFPESYLS